MVYGAVFSKEPETIKQNQQEREAYDKDIRKMAEINQNRRDI